MKCSSENQIIDVLTLEVITMIGIGIAVVAMLGAQNWLHHSLNMGQLKSTSDQIATLDQRLAKLETRANDLDKQLSHLVGRLKGLRGAIVGHRVA